MNKPKVLRSFIDVPPDSPFPIQNLPYGVFSTRDRSPRVGVAIGDMILDPTALQPHGFFNGLYRSGKSVFAYASLNNFMALGRSAWQEARTTIQHLLNADTPALRDNAAMRQQALVPMHEATLHMPVEIGDYTDFYSSREHATNMGIMFRGRDNALLPNWLHVPIAYHGRSSSIVPSGTDIRRPHGQIKPVGATTPIFAPSASMDFELELGFFVGQGNPLGQPIPVDKAADTIFGAVLVNDWSARDIQQWEYQPLGPFLAKNLATSISLWVVPMAALEPFRVAGPLQDPAPLPYLRSDNSRAYNIQLEARLQSAMMESPATLSCTNARHLYWNVSQQVAHHTINGCNLRPGDLLATGTISGPTPDSYGSLLELTWNGVKPLTLLNGELRKFLEDGDRLTLTGWCQGDGYRVGFGEVTGKLLPALDLG